jgi:hypothetical protein
MGIRWHYAGTRGLPGFYSAGESIVVLAAPFPAKSNEIARRAWVTGALAPGDGSPRLKAPIQVATAEELGGLASEVASRYEACQITRKLAPGNVADRYYPKDQSFEILAQSLGVEISDLKEQVSRTILGHSLVD